jgi:hypothetical protein
VPLFHIFCSKMPIPNEASMYFSYFEHVPPVFHAACVRRPAAHKKPEGKAKRLALRPRWGFIGC